MNRLSVAMIAHNESAIIGEALKSVAWADQIVVVDCRSNDDTADQARRAGAVVLTSPNYSNLNINKNLAIDTCIGDWILVLDADERIPDALAGEIRRVINHPDCAGYLIPRRNYVLGKWLRHGGQYPDLQLRLFRRNAGRFPAQHVHERLKVQGRVGVLREAMEHHPYLSVDDMWRKGGFYARFEAEHLVGLGRRPKGTAELLLRAVWSPGVRFFRRYFLKGGFRDGVPGLAAATFDAINHSVRWIWLWDIRRRGEDSLR